MTDRKPRGYWNNFDNVEKTLVELIKQLGHFPTQLELKERKMSGMATAIADHHKGLVAVKEVMGYEIETKKRGYWENIKNVEKEIIELFLKYGLENLPSQKWMSDHGHSSLSKAIIDHGGFRIFREVRGESQIRLTKEQAMDLTYCKDIAQKAMEENGWDTLPGHTTLLDKGYGSLVGSVFRYHGGFHKFKQKLGLAVKKKNGWHSNLKNIINEAKNAMKKKGWKTLPSTEVLRKEGYEMLVHAVLRYHGGLYEFRKLLGQTPDRVKHGSWKNPEFILEQAISFMDKHPEYETLPSSYTLCKYHQCSSLGAAFGNYPGGLTALRGEIEQSTKNSRKIQTESLLEGYVHGR